MVLDTPVFSPPVVNWIIQIPVVCPNVRLPDRLTRPGPPEADLK